MRIAVHMNGARRSYALPTMLHRADLLDVLATDVYCRGPWHRALRQATRLSKSPALGSLMARHQALLPDRKVLQLGWGGVKSIRERRRAATIMDSLRINAEVSREIAGLLRSRADKFNVLYCFALSAHICREVFPDKFIVLDQMHIPIKKLIPEMREEFRRYGDWFLEDAGDYDNVEREMVQVEEKDLRSADLILCPSAATQRNLLDSYSFDDDRVQFCPYTNPLWLNHHGHPRSDDRQAEKKADREGKLRVFFAGTVGVRKGVVYLLQAIEKLDPASVEIRIAGSNKLRPEITAKYSDRVEFLGRLQTDELAKQYDWADVFVFPSLGEGSAGVVQEAMAFGLPVVATFESGADMEDGREGFVIPERNSDAIAEALQKYIDDRSLLVEHAKGALASARGRELEPGAEKLRAVLSRAFAERRKAISS
ncbi:glycosyltransferase family 4 protein [bacterium]|nr:glycosyltransferase family 4 protein [bacterium]